jgi:hypothetical protein
MLTYILPIPAPEVVRLLQAAVKAAHGQPELYHNAWEDYLIEEDFDRLRYGITNGGEYSLVSLDAVLNIEPRLEQNYWVLRVIVHKELGPQQIDDTAALIGVTLPLEQFESFLADNPGAASVRLDVATRFAKQHFDAWLAEQWQRHPRQ